MENQQYYAELAMGMMRGHITCEEAIALDKQRQERQEREIRRSNMATREELIDVIQHLRDYISNDNIPVEDSDRLYQESLALADSVLPRVIFCCHACEMEIIENSEDHDNCCTEDGGVTWWCMDCWSMRVEEN